MISDTDSPVEEGEAVELSVLIPLCNEEENVALLFERLCDALRDIGKTWELIIVDDGSTDATLLNVKKEFGRANLDMRIIEFQRNFGKAAALQAGFEAARGELTVTLDGDLQNDPYDIPAMIEALEARNLDLLCGWRKSRHDGLVLRLIPSWFANQLIRNITKVRIHDYGCGLKLYRSNIIKPIKLIGGMHRFIPALVAMSVPTSRIGEMVVKHFPRQFGVSKYGISRTLRVFLDLLSVLFFMRFRARPAHFFGSIGLILGALSALIFLYLGFVKFAHGESIGTRPLLMVGVVFFLSSMQFITTGILAEILVRTGQNEQVANFVIRAVSTRPSEG